MIKDILQTVQRAKKHWMATVHLPPTSPAPTATPSTTDVLETRTSQTEEETDGIIRTEERGTRSKGSRCRHLALGFLRGLERLWNLNLSFKGLLLHLKMRTGPWFKLCVYKLSNWSHPSLSSKTSKKAFQGSNSVDQEFFIFQLSFTIFFSKLQSYQPNYMRWSKSRHHAFLQYLHKGLEQCDQIWRNVKSFEGL